LKLSPELQVYLTLLALPCRAAVSPKLQTPGRSRAGLIKAQHTAQPHFESTGRLSGFDVECKLIRDEVVNYRAIKEELRHKYTYAAGNVIDGATKERADQARPRPSE